MARRWGAACVALAVLLAGCSSGYNPESAADYVVETYDDPTVPRTLMFKDLRSWLRTMEKEEGEAKVYLVARRIAREIRASGEFGRVDSEEARRASRLLVAIILKDTFGQDWAHEHAPEFAVNSPNPPVPGD